MDCFIITSVFEPINAPLTYSPIRSVFNRTERFNQTIDSIKSVKQHLPNAYIVLVEGCGVALTEDEKKQLNVNYIHEILDENVLIDIRSPYKSRAETSMLLDYMRSSHFKSIKSIIRRLFKLSGRYCLKPEFNEKQFEMNKITLLNKDQHSLNGTCTVLYSIPYEHIEYYYKRLELIYPNIHDSMEYILFEPNERLDIYKKINRLDTFGYVTTTGEYWES